MRPAEYAKAIVAGVTAAGGTLVTALSDGSINATEWIVVVVTTVTAVGAVFGIGNAKPAQNDAKT